MELAVAENFVMQMRAGRISGRAHQPELLAAFAYLTGVADAMGMSILGMLDEVLEQNF